MSSGSDRVEVKVACVCELLKHRVRDILTNPKDINHC